MEYMVEKIDLNVQILQVWNYLFCLKINISILSFSSSISLYLILNQIDTEIANKGKDCWKGCEKTQGRCEWCGTEGWCCRLGWEGNGCDGGMGAKGMGHVCTGKGNHRCKIFCKFSFDFFHLA